MGQTSEKSEQATDDRDQAGPLPMQAPPENSAPVRCGDDGAEGKEYVGRHEYHGLYCLWPRLHAALLTRGSIPCSGIRPDPFLLRHSLWYRFTTTGRDQVNCLLCVDPELDEEDGRQ
jgi:hypothetical protein